MITLSDQLFVSLPLPDDARATNLVLEGSTIKVENREAYLARVDFNSRYLGAEVDFLSPSGTYGLNDFLAKINNGYIVNTKYSFIDGTEDEFFVPVPCCAAGGGDGFDPSLDYLITGNWTFQSTNIHNGNELFTNIIFKNDGTPITWTSAVNSNGDLNFTNNSTGVYVKFTPGGLVTNSCITTPGITIQGPTGFVKSDCSVDTNTYLSEETDPIFTAWNKQTGITIYWDQIIDAPSGGGDCELTEQDCYNIKHIDEKIAAFNCSGLLHNELDGLQGGNGTDEFYHLTEAEHIFVSNIVLNGSGVLASHTELTDIGINTHDQIDSHIANTTIHLSVADVAANEVDPVFTAERNNLTQNRIIMKGPSSLVNSDISQDSTTLPDRTIFEIPGAIYAGENYNIMIGPHAGDTLNLVSQGVSRNTLIGDYAGYGNITGYSNVFLGSFAGSLLADGISDNEFSRQSIYIGADSRAGTNVSENEVVIGYATIGNGTNTVTIGNEEITDNYLNGILHVSKLEVAPDIYISYDISGNMIFRDPIVGAEVTLLQLLAGGSGGNWLLAANNTDPISVTNQTVSFNGIGGIVTTRTNSNIGISLSNTGVTPGDYINPELHVDAQGRITAIASGTSGCEQTIADMGIVSGNTSLSLDDYAGAILTLSGNTTFTFENTMEGDTGHIEVTHSGTQTLTFTSSEASVKIANSCRATAGQVILTPYPATDVIVYWRAKTKIHVAVIYDTK